MTSRTFADDYAWQLTYQPAVREILTETFAADDGDIQFTARESEDDRHFNTDIWVRVDGHIQRVSQRLRRYVVGDEFTLRYARPGSRTEWQKVWAGFGRFYVYGRGMPSGHLEDWFVGDLAVFKAWCMEYLDRGEDPPHITKTNRDGSSEFVAFSRRDLPPEFTIAEDPNAEVREACWAVVKDSRGMDATGHASVVRWARAWLGLD